MPCHPFQRVKRGSHPQHHQKGSAVPHVSFVVWCHVCRASMLESATACLGQAIVNGQHTEQSRSKLISILQAMLKVLLQPTPHTLARLGA